MEMEWWQWAVAGIVLVLAELAVPAFVLIWFGLGALIVALIVAFLPQLGSTAQLSVWLGVSLALVGLWFKIFKPNIHKTHVGMSDYNLVGEIGLLTHDVAPFQNGEVRFQKPMLGSDVWPCMSDDTIPAGTRVKVVSVEGSLLKVGKI
jgi:inner membrane protein